MAAQLNIIVVEDHDVLRDELVSYLNRPDWLVRGVDCGEALDAALLTRMADVVVLDLNLPMEDGLDILKRLKNARPQLGVILLTGRTRPSERTEGYAQGADVYLTKPTSVRELEAVITTLGQRVRIEPPTGLVLDVPRMRLVAPDGDSVELSITETEILMQLAMAPERQLETGFLLRKLSHEYAIKKSREGLTVILSRLRQKLLASIREGDVIRAIRGYGYKLTIPINIKN